jgi:hypothetical protein
MYKGGQKYLQEVSSSATSTLTSYNHQNTFITQQHTLKMHLATPLMLLTAALAVAAPTADPNNKGNDKKGYISDCKKDLDNKWNQKNDDWKKNEKLFYFDAEYIVKATPDQVINTTQIPAPGQPGAKGLFKYGINIADNTICYVRPPHPPHVPLTKRPLTYRRTSPSPASPANTSPWP